MKTITRALASKLTIASICLAASVLLTIGSGSAYALSLGTNITKYDGLTGGIGIGSEDNEAEPGMVQSQAWDLEAFQLQTDRKQLSVVGGYNFYTGFGGTKMGDIFIGREGKAIYSAAISGFNYDLYKAPGYAPLKNVFNYDYVIDVNWTDGTYSIYSLTSDSLLQDTEYGNAHNTHSNPWQYYSDGILVQGSRAVADKGAAYTDLESGFSGWNIPDQRYVATFDVSSITSYLDGGAIFHTTMECGNDNLIGDAAAVPEPGTMMLLGMGMLGLAVYGKRRMNKEA